MGDDHRLAPSLLARTFEATETASLLPELKSEYQAAAMAANGDCTRLVLVNNKKGFELGGRAYIALQYVHLGTGEFSFTATGHAFTFLYSDYQPKRLTVDGRNLLRIFDYITLHRMPWIRVIDRDLRAIDDVSQEPVITALTLEDWKPERPMGD